MPAQSEISRGISQQPTEPLSQRRISRRGFLGVLTAGAVVAACDNTWINKIISSLPTPGPTPTPESTPTPKPTETPRSHEGLSSDVDIAQQQFLSGKWKLPDENLWTDTVNRIKIPLGTDNAQLHNNVDANWEFLGAYLGGKTVGDRYCALYGFYDKKGEPYTIPVDVGLNLKQPIALEALVDNVWNITEFGKNQIPVSQVVTNLQDHNGEVIPFLTFIRTYPTDPPLVHDTIVKGKIGNKAAFEFAWKSTNRGSYKDQNPPVWVNMPLDKAVKQQHLPLTMVLFYVAPLAVVTN